MHITGGLIAFIVVHGVLSGGIGAFPPFFVSQLTPDVRTAVILSIPVAGSIFGAIFGSFKHASALCDSSMMAGAAVFFIVCTNISWWFFTYVDFHAQFKNSTFHVDKILYISSISPFS